MAQTPKQMMAPAQLTNSAATKYTAPAGGAIIRQIILQNPGTANPVTISVGTDAAGKRILDAVSVPDTRTTGPYILHLYQVLTNGEVVQAFATTGSQTVMMMSGVELS